MKWKNVKIKTLVRHATKIFEIVIILTDFVTKANELSVRITKYWTNYKTCAVFPYHIVSDKNQKCVVFGRKKFAVFSYGPFWGRNQKCKVFGFNGRPGTPGRFACTTPGYLRWKIAKLGGPRPHHWRRSENVQKFPRHDTRDELPSPPGARAKNLFGGRPGEIRNVGGWGCGRQTSKYIVIIKRVWYTAALLIIGNHPPVRAYRIASRTSPSPATGTRPAKSGVLRVGTWDETVSSRLSLRVSGSFYYYVFRGSYRSVRRAVSGGGNQ